MDFLLFSIFVGKEEGSEANEMYRAEVRALRPIRLGLWPWSNFTPFPHVRIPPEFPYLTIKLIVSDTLRLMNSVD